MADAKITKTRKPRGPSAPKPWCLVYTVGEDDTLTVYYIGNQAADAIRALAANQTLGVKIYTGVPLVDGTRAQA